MSRPASAYSDDVTIYLVLNDHSQFGIAYDETDPAEADREAMAEFTVEHRAKGLALLENVWG